MTFENVQADIILNRDPVYRTEDICMVLAANLINQYSHTNIQSFAGYSSDSKCFKILKIFLFLFLNSMLDIRAGFHKMHVRIANREGPDQTASS